MTPTIWPAGYPTVVTIIGTNLCLGNDWLFVPTGTIEQDIFYLVLTSTEMQFSVTPGANDPTETATVLVGLNDGQGGIVWNFVPETAQIIHCPAPIVTSLLPKTWFAGESYPIKILGTGFTPPSSPNGCPVTPVTGTASAGLSGVTVVSATEIDATAAPDASDPTEIASINVGTGTQPVKTEILGNQIKFNGNPISTTDGSQPPVQNVVAGQQIALTTTMPLTTYYDGPSIPQPWTVGGTNIGGYPASTAGASVTPTTLNQPSLTTYWPYAGTNAVTFQYCVNIQGANPVNQCSLPATAKFTVTGPTGSAIATTQSVMVTPQQIPLCDGTTTTAQLLVFGANIGPGTCAPGNTGGIAIKGNYGITIASPVSSSNGSLEWIQVITANQFTETSPGASTPTSYDCGEGLDNGLPYPNTQTINGALTAFDVPTQGLVAPYIGYSKTFNAVTYLMWQSDIPGSILVPLGYVPWNWSGAAGQNVATQTWSLGAGATWSVNPSFVISSDSDSTTHGYPTWTALITNYGSGSNGGVCKSFTTNAEEVQ